MEFEQLLKNGVCYAYLMRMLKAVLTTKKIALWGDFFCIYQKKTLPLQPQHHTLCVVILIALRVLKALTDLRDLRVLKDLIAFKTNNNINLLKKSFSLLLGRVGVGKL